MGCFKPSEGWQISRRRVCWLVAGFVVGLSSCTDSGGDFQGGVLRRSPWIASCVSGRDDWRPSKNPIVETVLDPALSQPQLGLTFANDRIITFDDETGRITTFTSWGERVASVGRMGDGPGEFRRPRAGGVVMPHGAIADWLAASHDTLFVFDGRRLQMIDLEGRYIAEVRELSAITSGRGPVLSSRLRADREAILVDIERQGGTGAGEEVDERTMTIWRIVPHLSVTPVFSISLPSLPRTDRGTVFYGSTQAQPLWDLRGDCLVMSDGASPFLIVGSLSAGTRDTVPVRMPSRAVESSGESQELMARMGSTARLPEPTAPRRIRAMTVSPDGWIWLLPVQPPGLNGLEVLRFNLRSRAQQTDTVPVFPAAFGPAGELFGVATDRDGVRSVRRVRFRAGELR